MFGVQANNVEQVSVFSPQVNVSYQVRLIAKVFSESSMQNISLVITSGAGEVHGKSVASNYDDSSGRLSYNALSCGENEQMVTIRKSDRGGDGWNGGYYTIVNERTSSVVFVSTMNSTASSDIIDYDSLCLGVGETYNISLHSGEDENNEYDFGQLQQMGVTVQQCGVYLSEYQNSDLIDIVASNLCNPCRNSSLNSSLFDEGEHDDSFFGLDLILVGSLYGVPYGMIFMRHHTLFHFNNLYAILSGWKGASKYSIHSNGHLLLEGTLLVGMLEERSLCLPAMSSYEIVLENVPSSDDFLDDDWVTNFVGVSEYQLGVHGCNNTKYWNKKLSHAGHAKEVESDDEVITIGRKEEVLFVKPGHVIHVQIGSAGKCEMYSDDEDSNFVLFPWYWELTVTIVASVICSGLIIACLYWRGMRPMGKSEDQETLRVRQSASHDDINKSVVSHFENSEDVHQDYYEEDDDIDVEIELGNSGLSANTKKSTGSRILRKLRENTRKKQHHKYSKFSTSSQI